MELLKRLIYIYRLPSLPAAPNFTNFNNSYLSSEISLFAILDVCLKSDFGSSLTLTSFFTRSAFRLEISARYSDALYSELLLGSRLIEIFGIGGYSGDIFSSFIFCSFINCFEIGLSFSELRPLSRSLRRFFSFLLLNRNIN